MYWYILKFIPLKWNPGYAPIPTRSGAEPKLQAKLQHFKDTFLQFYAIVVAAPGNNLRTRLKQTSVGVCGSYTLHFFEFDCGGDRSHTYAVHPFVYPKSQHCKYRIYFKNLSPWLRNKTSVAYTVFEQIPVWTGFSSQTGLIICNSSISVHILRLVLRQKKRFDSVLCNMWPLPPLTYADK